MAYQPKRNYGSWQRGSQQQSAPEDYWREVRTVVDIPKTDSTWVRVQVGTKSNGERCISIRQWYITTADPLTPRASQTGINIPIEFGDLIHTAIESALNPQMHDMHNWQELAGDIPIVIYDSKGNPISGSNANLTEEETKELEAAFAKMPADVKAKLLAKLHGPEEPKQ